MYNSIYPVNINYRKNNPYLTQKGGSQNAPEENTNLLSKSSPQDTFTPQSTQINISQILMDFKNTIVAINAPDDIKSEVNDYLNLVDKEAHKQNPSRDIILSNLRNASKISDEYITETLGKKSNVVEGWITTIFRQDINLRANPDEINPDFLLKFPQKAQAKIEEENSNFQNASESIEQKEESAPPQEIAQEIPEEVPEGIYPKEEEAQAATESPKITFSDEKIEAKTSFELSNSGISTQEEIEPPIQDNITSIKKTSFTPLSESDKTARDLLLSAKKLPRDSISAAQAINLINDALGLLESDENSNPNIQAAAHLDRGKIFDEYDYVDYAVRDFWEATKATDLNLKANAFYKLASIYDEFRVYDPALDNYLSSVAYSGEAENYNAQSQVLSKIASLYTKQFDKENTQSYTDLSIDVALSTENPKTIAKTYSQGAQNYQYLGENIKALEGYKNALSMYYRADEDPEIMAYNYEQAADVMESLGNRAKADKLRQKALLYYQRAQLLEGELAKAS